MKYKDAGVDIEAGNALVDRIKPLIKSTNRDGVVGGIGGFGGLFEMKGYKNPLLVSATDGVGTKLKIAQSMGKHDTIGIDLVAMCVNDLVVQGAEPLFFLDYFATGKLDISIAESVISGIADGCRQAGSAIVGGETAEMASMYGDDEYDLAGFSVGAVEKENLLPKRAEHGDILLGLKSSGVHSNGFSLVRHIMKEKGYEYSSPAPFSAGKTLGEVFLEPTKIYVKACLAVAKKVKAFAHITGGGLTENIPRVLPDGMTTKLEHIEFPAVFKWLQKEGNISDSEMLRTFNCGIGMVVIVSEENREEVEKILQENGEEVVYLGLVI